MHPFVPSELILPDDDPPDVSFRDASFEVKEVQDRGRKRHDEYKRKLAKARRAERVGDLMEAFSPENMPIAAVCERLMEETQKLACGKYPANMRRAIDLLFYINFGIERHGPSWTGCRLILNLYNLRAGAPYHSSTALPLAAYWSPAPEAPEFLRAPQGQLIRGAVSE